MSDNVTSVRKFIHENASNNDSTGLNASDNVTSVTDNHKRLAACKFNHANASNYDSAGLNASDNVTSVSDVGKWPAAHKVYMRSVLIWFTK